MQTQINRLDEELSKQNNILKEAKAAEIQSIRDLNLCENEITQLDQ